MAFFAALPLVAFCAAPARAADAPAAPTIGAFSFFDEIRGGVFSNVLHTSWESGSVELLSSQLPFYSGSNPLLAYFLKPRLVVGGMVSVEGRISYAYTGVNWRVPIYDRLFAKVEFGGALNDSEKGATGLVGLPGHLPRIRRAGGPDYLQYRHRREHRARLSRGPVRPAKSRPDQFRAAARI